MSAYEWAAQMRVHAHQGTFTARPEIGGVMPRDEWQQARINDGLPGFSSGSYYAEIARDKPKSSWLDGPLGVGMQATMPFGKHIGKPISDVPASYLRWFR